jgi:hypothetical protein
MALTTRMQNCHFLINSFRLNYVTLGNLVKDLITGKLTHVTEDQQIDIMKTNLQTTGQITGLSGKPYDFYKQIDIDDLHKYLIEKYHEHTGNSYRNYFEKYASIFFGPNPDIELLLASFANKNLLLAKII